ncbi:FliM/FliN family flagellar motor C-terminal domain-containing protein [Thioclava sp. GXIMD2076]|uniref:FliM/FliN family flagellar motor C-terminal domain-containing protein n=1 Tax=Thioclava kandeliae TaxID=3070818 RepID=A0ABV1SBX4_9RHOB
MRKKTDAAKAAASGGPVSPERAIRYVFAKVAQDTLDLPLQVLRVEQSQVSLTELMEVFPEQPMLCVLEGPKEAFGVVALPPITFSSLIEVQTMGVLSRIQPGPRRPTRVDASMVQGVLDSLLEGLEEALADSDDIIWAGGFRYLSFFDDPRPLSLILEEITYRVFSITMQIGQAMDREVSMLWAVPARGRGERVLAATAEDAGAPEAEALWAQQMESTVMGTRAELTAVLHRWSMPLSGVMSFKPGVEIPIPREALEKLRVEGVDGRRMGTAKLGQHSGRRALRLTANEAESTEINELDELTTRPDLGAMSVGDNPFGGMTGAEGGFPAMGGDADEGGFPAMDLGGLGGDDAGDGGFPAMDFSAFEEDENQRTGTGG